MKAKKTAVPLVVNFFPAFVEFLDRGINLFILSANSWSRPERRARSIAQNDSKNIRIDRLIRTLFSRLRNKGNIYLPGLTDFLHHIPSIDNLPAAIAPVIPRVCFP